MFRSFIICSLFLMTQGHNGGLRQASNRRLVEVSCGRHTSPTCSQCGPENMCNGACKWDGPSGTCVEAFLVCDTGSEGSWCTESAGCTLYDNDQRPGPCQVSVSCGNHISPFCTSCGPEVYCNGDCEFDNGTCKPAAVIPVSPPVAPPTAQPAPKPANSNNAQPVPEPADSTNADPVKESEENKIFGGLSLGELLATVIVPLAVAAVGILIAAMQYEKCCFGKKSNATAGASSKPSEKSVNVVINNTNNQE